MGKRRTGGGRQGNVNEDQKIVMLFNIDPQKPLTNRQSKHMKGRSELNVHISRAVPYFPTFGFHAELQNRLGGWGRSCRT